MYLCALCRIKMAENELCSDFRVIEWHASLDEIQLVHIIYTRVVYLKYNNILKKKTRLQ